MHAKQQELLVRTGPGTPCGKLLRSYWQPIALAEELPRGGAPIPVTVFGEELVLYRDAQARIGLLGRRCPHRGVDLCYGRTEDEGLRCIYHGWLFDTEGALLEQPGLRDQKTAASGRIRHKAYPCHEAGGLIFAYMGAGEPPLFPAYEFLDTSEDERFVSKIFHDCNYFQGVEGNMDQVHLSFLHRLRPNKAKALLDLAERAPGSQSSPMALLTLDATPNIEVQKTGFGMREVVTRSAPEGTYVKVENFALPGFSAVPGSTHGDRGYLVNWHVPIDDETHWKYMVTFKRGGLDRKKIRDSLFGDVPFGADYKFAKPAERYAQNREAMASGEAFAGLGPGFAYHDLVIIEAQGKIHDRTNEILGPEDKSVVLVRRIMLEAIADVEEGRDPPHVVREASQNVFPELVVLAEVIPQTKDPEEHVAERVSSRMAGTRSGSLV
jgi:phthalate 4,5-dioxygenase oxygenase subunit